MDRKPRTSKYYITVSKKYLLLTGIGITYNYAVFKLKTIFKNVCNDMGMRYEE